MSNDKEQSPIADLQQQYILLGKEYEYEKELYRQQTQQAGVLKRVRQGVCWYPVRVNGNRYNSLNQLTVEIEKDEPDDVDSVFEYGRPVCFLRYRRQGLCVILISRQRSVMYRMIKWWLSCLGQRH